MKHLLLIFLIGLGFASFAQETVIKEKTKTKIEGGPSKEYKHKVEAEGPAKTVIQADTKTHAAYRPAHAARSYKYNHSAYRVRRHHTAHKATHKVRRHKAAKHRHYKEMKKKYRKGKTKIKYEY